MSRRLWTRYEKRLLRLLLGTIPRRQIAERLGRSETAVMVKRKRLGLRSPQYWDYVLTVSRLADALGVDTKTAHRLMDDGRMGEFVVTVYCGNQAVQAVPLVSLEKWVADPNNWYAFDPDKVEHPELKAAVAKTKAWWDDEWLTVQEACEILHVCTSWLTARLRDGRIVGRKWGYNWRVLRSVIERKAEELHEPAAWLREAADDVGMREFQRL